MKITILGGTGYVGSHIAQEAASRGLEVNVVARKLPSSDSPVSDSSLHYTVGDATDLKKLPQLVEGSDVIVSALSPRGSMVGHVLPANKALAQIAASEKKRLIVIGGYSAMRLEPHGLRIAEKGKLPDWLADEAKEMAAVIDWLENSAPADLQWLYVSPAQNFSAKSGTETTGHYFVGDDVVRVRNSVISVEDLALGIVDEIVRCEHSGHILLRS